MNLKKDELIKIYCVLYEGEEKADLLKKCLGAESDFKDYLCNQIDWKKFENYIKENENEFREYNIL